MIINNIDQLKLTAKINRATPFEAFDPFLQEARDVFLVRYLGDELVEVLEQATVPERAVKLLSLTQYALGPLALWLGISELSVRMGDAGFTVEKRDGSNNGAGYVPASDSKIEKLAESFQRRGFTYLDKVLEYLEANSSDFPEWTNSRYYTLRAGNYIQSAFQFQDIGGVDIEYSRLTFEHLRAVMNMIELRFITELLGDTLDASLRSKLNGTQTNAESQLIANIRRFVACKTAEYHTSVSSKQNQESSSQREYKALIRPIYGDVTSTGNFFTEQSAFYYSKIQQLLNTNAVALGITPVDGALNWNNTDNKLFTDIG